MLAAILMGETPYLTSRSIGVAHARMSNQITRMTRMAMPPQVQPGDTLDLKDRAVRVNTLSPGATRTSGVVDLAGPDAKQQQGLLDYLASQVPLGRVG